CMIGHNNVVLF
nr:immunoglobulin light chain junction region [Macaca mulatta]